MLYRVRTPAQLAVYEAAFRVGIRSILDETGPDFGKTEDDVWRELAEHLTNTEDRGVWVFLDQGVLRCWAAMKVYSDDGRLAGCVTWAWASPAARGEPARAVMEAMEQAARDAGAEGIFAQRRTRVRAFIRTVRRYGWKPEAVIVGKVFSRAKEMTHRVSTVAEVTSGEQAVAKGIDDGARATPSAGVFEATPLAARAPGDRPAAPAPEHGAGGAAPAGDLESPKRRARRAPRRVREPAESGHADARPAGSAGS